MSDDRYVPAEGEPRAERATPRPEALGDALPAGDRVCGICGAPAVGACVKCGSWYCVEHRGVEALPDEPVQEGEGPRICWNCRLSSNAGAVLFWVAVAAVGLTALIVFFSLWA